MLRVRWLIAALDERVGGHAQVLVLGRHRRDVQDRAAAGLLDMRHRDLRQAEGREDVDLVGPAEIVHRHVEGLGPAAAGVVDEDRQAAELSIAACTAACRSSSLVTLQARPTALPPASVIAVATLSAVSA